MTTEIELKPDNINLVLTWERQVRRRLTLASALKKRKLQKPGTPNVNGIWNRFESAFEQELRALSSVPFLARRAGS